MIVARKAAQDGTLPADVAADYDREMKALVATRFNSPSIVSWDPCLMTYDRKLLKFKLERLAALHRELIEAGR